ncbi:MAG: ergothioneine biosynthesis protein EgtB [Dokdonella sp.]
MLTFQSPARTCDASLAEQFGRIRARTLALAAPLAPEDTVVQSMPEASPTKWHLAHTTWFFERFVLAREPGYRPVHPDWMVLFNSYYQSVGPMHARGERGLLSRPTFAEVLDYRAQIDERVLALLSRGTDAQSTLVASLGLQHEQQHQELVLTDIKHLFSVNPLQPAYLATLPVSHDEQSMPLGFVAGREGIAEIGHVGTTFAFDNETPRHRVLLRPHVIANRPINNGEFRDFIRDGGYRKPALWLAEGWDIAQQRGWERPLYWNEDLASAFTLGGHRALRALAPACHVSFFEADAFARWAGARLPTEAEWECVAAEAPRVGNLQNSGCFEPQPPSATAGVQQLYGDVWEWTASPYVAYPGFQPLEGSLGEYNAKFMCGQWVLRGGSCATPTEHIRASYRNFFHPADRWQFSGLRLAKDA